MADNKVNSGLLEFSEDQKVFVALDAETSEVKKAVTIDGDGVETDIQGVQPSGKKEITSTAEVNVASYATAQVVDEDLVAGNIKKDVDILGVVGSYEGGGASDFSTAKMTITGPTEANYLNVLGAMAVDYHDEEYPEDDDSYTESSTNETSNSELQIVMYKGKAYVSLIPYPAQTEMTISGNIEATHIENKYIVTGDCSVTISAAHNS